MKTEQGILIVDDEQTILDLLTCFVQRMGFQAHVTTSGKAAADMYRKNPEAIDLAILDLTMMPVDGIQIYESLRRTTTDLGILFSSGQDRTAIHELLSQDRRCGFINKPFAYRQLSDAIQGLIEPEPP